MNHAFNKILIWPILGLIIGAGLYFWDAFSSYERDIVIPIHYVHVPKGLMITGIKPGNLEIHLKGPSSELRKFNEAQLSYSLSLAGAVAGVNLITVQSESVPVPKGIIAEKVNPATVTLRLEEEAILELPVHVVTSGKAATGYVVGEISVTPRMLSIRGPVGAVNVMEKIDTKPIDITGMMDSFKMEVVPDLAEDIEIVSANKVITVEMKMVEHIVEKRFEGIRVLGKGAKRQYEVMPRTVDIEVRGPENNMEKLKPEDDIQAIVDLTGLKPGIYVRRASIVLPLDMVLVTAEPEIFTVTLTKSD